MSTRYIAFDIETAKALPAHVTDLKAHRPLGICCAATLVAADDGPRLWHGKADDGKPSRQMTRDDAAQLVEYLSAVTRDGYLIVTWNGLGFDFDILAEESGMWAECRWLARGHVDMMFHAHCELGYPVGLDRAAKASGLKGKSPKVAQHLVPQLWSDGKADEVLEYLVQDVRTTLELAVECEHRRSLKWIAQSGKIRSFALRPAWLTVEQAMRLPEPDTSWMQSRLPRSHFTSWLYEDLK
jgi:hypothetical protein